MTRSYQAIDADGHILEPLDLWEKYIDPAFHDRRPRFVIDENRKERLSVEGKLLGNPRGIGSLGSVGVRQGAVKLDSLKYADGKKGGFDPHARILDMNADGIDAAFLYPSLGLFAGAVEDPSLAAATCRAYNRWLADYCKPYPDRLFGVAMLPLQDVDPDDQGDYVCPQGAGHARRLHSAEHRLEGVSPETRRQVMAGGAMGFYD